MCAARQLPRCLAPCPLTPCPLGPWPSDPFASASLLPPPPQAQKVAAENDYIINTEELMHMAAMQVGPGGGGD